MVQDIEKKIAELQEAGKEKAAIEKNYKKLEETSKVSFFLSLSLTLVSLFRLIMLQFLRFLSFSYLKFWKLNMKGHLSNSFIISVND